MVKSLTSYQKTPAFVFKTRENLRTNLLSNSYLVFEKYIEMMSLSDAASKIQLFFRKKRAVRSFKLSKTKEISHYKKTINNTEYRIGFHRKKSFIHVEAYLLTKPLTGKWIHTARLYNNFIIEKYGDLEVGVLLKELSIENGELILGTNSSKESYQLQKHMSYALDEVLLQEKVLKKAEINDFEVFVWLKRFRNMYLEGAYEVIVIEVIGKNSFSREISIHLDKAASLIGIPKLWVQPISNFILKKCLVLDEEKFFFDFPMQKIKLGEVATKIQKVFRGFMVRNRLKRRTGKRRLSYKYRLTFINKSVK